MSVSVKRLKMVLVKALSEFDAGRGLSVSVLLQLIAAYLQSIPTVSSIGGSFKAAHITGIGLIPKSKWPIQPGRIVWKGGDPTSNSLIFTDLANHKVCSVDMKTQQIEVVAGSGRAWDKLIHSKTSPSLEWTFGRLEGLTTAPTDGSILVVDYYLGHVVHINNNGACAAIEYLAHSSKHHPGDVCCFAMKPSPPPTGGSSVGSDVSSSPSMAVVVCDSPGSKLYRVMLSAKVQAVSPWTELVMSLDSTAKLSLPTCMVVDDPRNPTYLYIGDNSDLIKRFELATGRLCPLNHPKFRATAIALIGTDRMLLATNTHSLYLIHPLSIDSAATNTNGRVLVAGTPSVVEEFKDGEIIESGTAFGTIRGVIASAEQSVAVCSDPHNFRLRRVDLLDQYLQ